LNMVQITSPDDNVDTPIDGQTVTYPTTPYDNSSGSTSPDGTNTITPIPSDALTITLVSGTWDDGTTIGEVTGFTYDPSVPNFIVTIDGTFVPSQSYTITLELKACEVECSDNCVTYTQIVTTTNVT